jgi:hypothetical protein
MALSSFAGVFALSVKEAGGLENALYALRKQEGAKNGRLFQSNTCLEHGKDYV